MNQEYEVVAWKLPYPRSIANNEEHTKQVASNSCNSYSKFVNLYCLRSFEAGEHAHAHCGEYKLECQRCVYPAYKTISVIFLNEVDVLQIVVVVRIYDVEFTADIRLELAHHCVALPVQSVF